MDFAEMRKCTGLGLRQLRYVVDYEVLDPKYCGRENTAQTGHGVAREFSQFGAFTVVLATVLREVGLSRRRVRSALEAIFDWVSPKSIPGEHPLVDAFMMFRGAAAIDLEIVDGQFLRVLAKESRSSRSGISIPKTSLWINLEQGGKTESAPKALFVTTISLLELSKRLADE
jgi:hypothetical protein